MPGDPMTRTISLVGQEEKELAIIPEISGFAECILAMLVREMCASLQALFAP